MATDWRVWQIGALAGALVLTGCGSGGKDAAKKGGGAAAGAAPSVVVATVQQKTVPVYTEVTARTDSPETVEIRARVGAFLDKQHFTEGTMVEKGQLLFTLDTREFDAQLMEAKAKLAKAEADLSLARDRSNVQTALANVEVAAANLAKSDLDVTRLKPLAEAQAVPQQDYDNALARQRAGRADVQATKATLNTTEVAQKSSIQQGEAAVLSAKAAIAQAELNLGFCRITSPISGLAGKREVAPGNLVGKAEPTLLVTVSVLDPIRVNLSISEADYLRLFKRQAKKGPGVPLELILADGSVFPQKGRIIIADRAVDLKTGTLSLIAEFPNPNRLLRPGQFGRVRAAVDTVENALLVPQKAVSELQSAQVVYVVGPENKVLLRTVTLGERVGADYIVLDGVKAGERIIVDGVQKARPGQPVTPTEQPATSEPSESKKGA